MKLSIKILAMFWGAVSWTLMVQPSATADDGVGVRHVAAVSRERGTDLDVMVWYPAAPGGRSTLVGASRFFVGTPAMLDAPISEGRFPLIVLSHGAGLAGSAQALSWMAMPLAKRGFVVAAPTHPGNAGANRSAAETMKLWLRPADLAETVTAMNKVPFFKGHLEQDAVGALGLSMGGSTALAIVGARMDAERLAGYCDTDALNPSLCGWIRQSGVDLHAMDMRAAGRDNKDRRIKFAMAIDPAPVDVFDLDSFSRITVPVALVNLGRRDAIPLTTHAERLAKAVPSSTYSVIEDASHYSMFGECKPDASGLAKSDEIEDPICTDGGGRTRRDIHGELIDMAAAAFERALRTSR